MDEELVLQTAQHGFSPSGMVNGQKTTPGHEEMNLNAALNNEMTAARSAAANCVITNNTLMRHL